MSRALHLLLVAACHKDGGPGAIDASIADARVDARPVDAGVDAPQYVFAVTCPGGPLPTIRGDDSVEDRYLPESVTIATNDVVMFVMSATHDVVPLPTDSDPGLRVGLGETKCLQFTTAGTFQFLCSPHGFTGSVVVQ